MSRRKKTHRRRRFLTNPAKKTAAPERKQQIVINRVQRIIQPQVPAELDWKELAELYRREGIEIGVGLTTMLPQQLIDQASLGNVPPNVDTVTLLGMMKKGLESAHRAACDNLEKQQAEIEGRVGCVAPKQRESAEDQFGYQPLVLEELIRPDVFVRLITIPEEEGGGYCAELDPGCRGDGETAGEALADLAELIDAHLARRKES